MIVVAFHLFETYSAGPHYQTLNHGYLAVDFFYVLSGFVIGYAYDDRWDRMTLGGFFKRRLVRLHPMLIAGTLVGAALFFMTDAPFFPHVSNTSLGMFLLVVLMGCLMLPTPPSMDVRGWQEMNSLNGASWSLFWEYCANILYATVIRRMPKWLLGICVVFFACLTINLTFNIDVLGLLDGRVDAMYTVIGGWSLAPDQIYIGLTRLLYPFFAGLLLSRMHHYISVRGGFWVCSLIVALVLVFPYAGIDGMEWTDGLYQAVAIIVVFPLVVAIGAGSHVSDKRSAAVCNFLGQISYPLYITHYPLIYLQMTWAANHQNAPVYQHVIVSVAIFLVAVGCAYAWLKLYDVPVRKWLREHWLMKGSAGAARQKA